MATQAHQAVIGMSKMRCCQTQMTTATMAAPVSRPAILLPRPIISEVAVSRAS